MLGKIAGNTVGAGLKPLIKSALKIVDAKERTKQVSEIAAMWCKIAASSWRPAIARAIEGAIVLWVIAAAILFLVNVWGVATESPWVVSKWVQTSEAVKTIEQTPLDRLWGRWIEVGKIIFGFAGLFLTTYAGGRSLEKFGSGEKPSKVGGMLGRVGRVITGTKPEPDIARTEAQQPTSAQERFKGGLDIPERVRLLQALPERVIEKYPANKNWEWSERSRRRLDRAAPDLQELFDWLLLRSPYDIGIIETTRTEAMQRVNIAKKVSKTMNSRHLERPAHAVDFYLINPKTGKPEIKNPDTDLYLDVLHVLKHGSQVLQIPITSGGLDWGWDFYHIELSRDHYPKMNSVLSVPA